MSNSVCSLIAKTAIDKVTIRAPIDRPISRESSASPDLIDDRSVHPVCDHKSSEQHHALHAATVWIQLAPHLSGSQIAVI